MSVCFVYLTTTVLLSGKFGASSPERERKLLSLAESGRQTRKAAKVSKSSYSLSVASGGQSPGPSPAQIRREGLGPGKSHERSHSDTPPVPVGELHRPLTIHSACVRLLFALIDHDPLAGLTAESSSVASLPGLRRGSVSSQDSQGGQPGEQEQRGQHRRPELPVRGERPPPAPHRPPDYQTAVRARVARTQSRDSSGRYSDTENETQVSAV